jgi:hypothetical protein
MSQLESMGSPLSHLRPAQHAAAPSSVRSAAKDSKSQSRTVPSSEHVAILRLVGEKLPHDVSGAIEGTVSVGRGACLGSDGEHR